MTNRQGYRIDEHTNTELEIQTCNWLFIGDSYTQGAQVNYEELFTTRLYRYFPDKIILNAGISGYSIVDAYNYYVHDGYKLTPDRVFLQLCIFNDFMNVTESIIGVKEYLMQYSNLYRYLKYNSLYANPDDLPLKRFTEPFYPTEQENMSYNIFYRPSSEQKRKDIENLTSYLTKLREVTRRHGAELCVLLVPTKEQISYTHFTEVVEKFQIDVEKLDLQYPGELIENLSKEIGFDLIDLYAELNDGNGFPFFYQDEHLNGTGHEKVAKAIYNRFTCEAEQYEYISQANTAERYPSFLPGNSSLLFQTFKNGYFQIATIDTFHRITPLLPYTSSHSIHPTLSGDGKWLAYVEGDQESGRTKVILHDLIAQTSHIVTGGDDEYGAIPSFSPNSGLMAYAGWWLHNEKFSNPVIILYNVHTAEKHILTRDHYESWRPIFHPRDSVLYFISKEYQDNFSLVSLDLHSCQTEIIIKKNFDIWDPAISNKGDRLLFAGREEDNWDLFLYDLEAKKEFRLTRTRGDEWDPAFGADETDIWFAGTFGINNGIYNFKINMP